MVRAVPHPELRIEPLSAWRSAPWQVLAARQRILAELRDLPIERWIGVDHLLERLERTAYELLFSRDVDVFDSFVSSFGNPYDRTNPFGWEFTPYFTEADGWQVVETGLIRTVIRALGWLGVLELGTSTTAGDAFRVTADGARLLAGAALDASAVEVNVVVQPNFRVFAVQPTDESILFELDTIADRLGADRVHEYQLSRESVYRAQRAGARLEEIVAFLQRVSSVELPQNVRRSLEQWGELHERVVVRTRAGLLHGADEQTLDGLYADPEVAPLLGRRVAPHGGPGAVEPPGGLEPTFVQWRSSASIERRPDQRAVGSHRRSSGWPTTTARASGGCPRPAGPRPRVRSRRSALPTADTDQSRTRRQ